MTRCREEEEVTGTNGEHLLGGPSSRPSGGGVARRRPPSRRPYAPVQALARWSGDKSVPIYARLSPDDYSTWVSNALRQKTTSCTTARLPVVIDDHDAAATSQLTSTYFHQAAADVAEENPNGVTPWRHAHPPVAVAEAGQRPSPQPPTGTRKPPHGGG